MKKIVLLAAVLLAGCATQQEPQYANCTVPVTRDAGQGVRVQGCAAWTIGTFRPVPKNGLRARPDKP
jgi:uncharacterized lipoprotein YmbA